jgi:sec-independent protein translocase protein TatB
VFNLSGSEIVVILLLALVVLGPEKLPDAIRKFGRTYAELKKMGAGFQQEFKSAIDEPMREMRETADLLKKSADFSTSSAAPPTAKPKNDGGPTPVIDTVTDRPVRNEGLAPGDPDTVPTDDVPFTDDDDVPLSDDDADDVPLTDDEPLTDDAADVPLTDDDVTAVAGPSDRPTDRGEADDG